MATLIAQYGHGGPEVLRAEDRDIAEPVLGEVSLAQKAIGFNYFDVLQRRGEISADVPGRVMGIEGAGVVAAIGPGVNGFAVGDRVGYLRSQGAYASARLIEADSLFHLPEDVSFEIAAALTVKGFMAWLCGCRLYEVQPGQIVLVTAAAGGVGSLITRLATHRGARVVGMVSSDGKRRAALDNGAVEAAIGLDDAIDTVARLTGRTGVDAVFDGIGVDSAERLLAAGSVQPGGTIVTFGRNSGWAEADRDAIARRGFTFLAPQAPDHLRSAGELRDAMAEVFALYRDGAFGEVAVTSYPLRDAATLHQQADDRTISGIALLKP